MTNQLIAELEMANRKINELTAESTEWESKYYDMQDNFNNVNEEIDRLNNIIKEVREYIENYNKVIRENKMLGEYANFMIIPKELLEILDKEKE